MKLRGGEARIGRVSFSKRGKTLYYNGKSLQSVKGGYKANYFEIESGDEYWISGCERDGSDRLYGERVRIEIDDDVRVGYALGQCSGMTLRRLSLGAI